MNEDNPDRESFEEKVYSIARELSRSVERMAQLNVDEIAGAIGVDPARAKGWIEEAGRWLSAHGEGLGGDADFERSGSGQDEPGSRRPVVDGDALRSAGPHPLDLPTEEQGTALAALDSGRWTVEPGSNLLVSRGGGPSPSESLGLVGELRARDWVAADGKVTLVGRNALGRWLDTADSE